MKIFVVIVDCMDVIEGWLIASDECKAFYTRADAENYAHEFKGDSRHIADVAEMELE